MFFQHYTTNYKDVNIIMGKKYYAGIAIDIKSSKSLTFNIGYGTYDILNYFSEHINQKYGAEISNSEEIYDSGKLFSIKEGDMLMGLIREYNYDLTRKIYHYLNSIYYSSDFQYNIKRWISTENSTELIFNMSIVFNGTVQQEQQNINTLSWDIINGTAISGTKYLLNSYHDDVPETKKIGGKFNNIENLPFKLRTVVLKNDPSEKLLINEYYSDLIQLLFYSGYSLPFKSNSILSIRKIIFFTLFNAENKRNMEYQNLFLVAATLDEIYGIKSYQNAASNIGIQFNELGQKIQTKTLQTKEKMKHKQKYSSRISKIIGDMDILSVQKNIDTLENTINRISNQ